MTQEEEIADLKKQLSKVLERLNGVLEQLSKAQERENQYLEQLAAAHKCIEELEKQKTPPAAFVKVNVKKPQAEAKKERKKRDPKHNHGRKQQHAFEQELWQLCAPYAHTSSPLHTLCERVERFLPELFVFVAVPGVPADNNLAERSVRPLVIARKISGGTRSPHGFETRMALFSLFGSWAAQGLNPFFQCLAVLAQPNPLG